jgi:siroheme decarboxylase
LVENPYDTLASRLGVGVERLLREVSGLISSGAIRRIGAIVHHRRLGYEANGMAVFAVPVARVDVVGGRLAALSRVTHCYRRAMAPGWHYSLFAMVHGRTRDEVAALVKRVAEEQSLPDYDILFSSIEFKKTSMKYFVEALWNS